MFGKIKGNYSLQVLTVFAVCFSLLNLFIVLVNHYNFRTFAFDYAAYNFAFFDFAHFRISPTPLHFQDHLFDVTFLQDHFSITLILLAPLYWLMSWATGTYTLLIVQWLFIVSGALATYRLILFKSNNRVLALLSFICFFVLFGRFAAADADCNLAIIGSAMVPVFFYFFETKKTIATLITFLFLVFNREDYPLWLFFIALFLAVVHRRDKLQLRLALIYMVTSAVFFIIIFKLFIPALESEYKKYTLFEFKALGKTPLDVLLFMITNPLQTLKLLVINHSGDSNYDFIKTEFYILYFISGAFLLLFRPVYLIPFIPLIAKKMFTDLPVRWSVEGYYSVEIVSILPLMIFMVLAGFRSLPLKQVVGSAVCLLAASVTVYKFYAQPVLPWYGGGGKYNFLSPAFYRSQFNLPEVNAAIAEIPDTAIVSASGRMAAHLAFRKRIYCYPKLVDAQYVLVFKQGDEYPMGLDEAKQSIANLRKDTDFRLLREGKDILFYKLDKQHTGK